MQPMSPKRQKPAVSVKDLEKYRKLALDAGASAARIIDASTIRTAWWVRQKCQYGCGGWGSSHCCPPFTPKPKETARVLADYRHALLVAYLSLAKTFPPRQKARQKPFPVRGTRGFGGGSQRPPG